MIKMPFNNKIKKMFKNRFKFNKNLKKTNLSIVKKV